MIASESHVSERRPFAGLRPFDFADREYFFGREQQQLALYRLVDRSRFVAVVGSSGSGKSSLVRAGLLPLLEQESADVSGPRWESLTLRPGNEPVEALADALAALATRTQSADTQVDPEIRRELIGFALERSSYGLAKALDQVPGIAGKSLLLVVDQFEELFRYANPGGEYGRASDSRWRDKAANFVQLLLEGSRMSSRPVHVLITMRSDFIGDCAQFQGLPEAVSVSQFLVPSLTRDQREEVIRQPIDKAGAKIDSDLVERLLNDAGSELDQLPVLQHCLSRLWEHAGQRSPAEPRTLTLSDYQEIHGIAGALSQHADQVMQSIPGVELAVEQTFRALSEVDKEGRATRRAITFSQLSAETGMSHDDLVVVLDRFRADDCSFIVTTPAAVHTLQPDTRVDVVHEALLRHWYKISAPRHENLVGGKTEMGWLFAEEDDGRLYSALLALLQRKSSSQKVTLPLDQVQDRWEWWNELPRTEAWAKRYGGKFELVEKLFGDSLAALADEKLKQEEQQRAKRDAEVERTRAASAQRLARRTRVFAVVVSLVALIAMASVVWAASLNRQQASLNLQLKSKINDVNTLARRLTKVNGTLQTQKTGLSTKNGLLLIQEGQLNSQKTKLQDLAGQLAVKNQQALGSMHQAMQQTGVAQNERAKSFVEAGRRALLNSQSDDAALYLGAAYVLDPNDRDLRVLLPQALDKISMRQGSVLADRNAPVTAVQFNPAPGTNEIATAGADGSVTLWNGTGQLLQKPMQDYDANDRITALAFDPTGRYLVTVAEDGSGRLHSLRSGATRRATALGNGASAHTGRVNAVTFSHGGTYLATAGADGKVIVWRSTTGSRVASRSVDAYVNDVVFTPDDGTVIGALADGRLLIWDWKGGRSPLLAAVSNTHLLHVAVNQSGTLLATGGADGTVALYDLRQHRVIASRNDSHAEVTAISFAPGDRVIASSSTQVYVLDATTGNIAATLGAQFGSPNVLDAVANPAGTQIATTYDNGAVALWAIDGRQIASFGVGQKTAVTVASFSPDGALLATAGDDGRMSLWRPGIALSRARATHHGSVESIAFNPSGTKMLTGSRDGTAVLWNAGGGLSEEATLPHSGTDWVVTSEFSGDGQRALTVGGGALRVWNVAGNDPSLTQTIRPTMRGKRFTDAAFVPNRGVLAIQTGADPLAGAPYTSNRWFIWSLNGKRIVSEDPKSWATAPRRIQIANDGKHAMFFAADTATLSIFDLSTGKNLFSSSSITAAALAHGSHRYGYAAGADNGTISFFPINGDRFFRRPYTGQGHVTAMAFSGDDRWLGFAHSDDPTIKIWDMSGSKLRALLLEHPGWGEIASIAFAPRDAAYVLTLSKDGSAELWDRDTGELLGAVRPPAGTASAVFTPDGRDVVLGSVDGSVYVWNLATALTPQMAANRILTQSDLSNPEANTLIDQAIRVLRGRARTIR